jgi:hypothetical protein
MKTASEITAYFGQDIGRQGQFGDAQKLAVELFDQ